MNEDLIILVCYVNVDGMSRMSANKYTSEIYESLKIEYKNIKNVKYHIIPVSGQETKIECIYPTNDKKQYTDNKILLLYKNLLNIKYNDKVEIKKIINNLERKLKIDKINRIKK